MFQVWKIQLGKKIYLEGKMNKKNERTKNSQYLFHPVVALHPCLPLLWCTIRDTLVLQKCGSTMIEACLYLTQDMLSIIDEKGSYVEKIFRKIANKSFWNLKEKLCTVDEVSLSKQSVLVVASVLKLKKVLASSTWCIPVEMHKSFPSLT